MADAKYNKQDIQRESDVTQMARKVAEAVIERIAKYKQMGDYMYMHMLIDKLQIATSTAKLMLNLEVEKYERDKNESSKVDDKMYYHEKINQFKFYLTIANQFEKELEHLTTIINKYKSIADLKSLTISDISNIIPNRVDNSSSLSSTAAANLDKLDKPAVDNSIKPISDLSPLLNVFMTAVTKLGDQ